MGTWPAGNNRLILQNYTYTLKKGNKPLQSFDTGEFNSGFHVGGANNVFIAPFLKVRIKGEKVNLCPDPSISMDNKVVDFNALDAKDFIGVNTVKDSFNLRVNVAPTCQTGLNISVTFNSNNGTVVNQKYLLLDKGLQAVITDNVLKQEVHFGVPYKKGNITTQFPGNYNYNVELSRESSQPLKAGEFSKTVNVFIHLSITVSPIILGLKIALIPSIIYNLIRKQFFILNTSQRVILLFESKYYVLNKIQ